MLGAAGYFGYQNRREIQTWDRKLLSAIAVGVAAFFGAEGYVLFFFSLFLASPTNMLFPSFFVSKNAKKQLK